MRTAATEAAPRALIPNAVLGTLLFLGAEVMFFAGLISAFLVLRASAATWPPADQPRLPVIVAGVNTLVLLASAGAMRRAQTAIRHDRSAALKRWLTATAVLGMTFLVVHGVEWIRLLQEGLRPSSGTYAAIFYALTGFLALHVLGGLAVLSTRLWQASRGRYSRQQHAAVDACFLYWGFIAAIGPLLYGLVYLL